MGPDSWVSDWVVMDFNVAMGTVYPFAMIKQ